MAKSNSLYQRGEKIGNRFRVFAVMRGGLGEVYVCLDETTQNPYALKTFRSQTLKDLKSFNAFRIEVENWIALGKHNNIVHCFSLQLLDNQPFLQLELIMGDPKYGPDLGDWIAKGSVTSRFGLEVTIDICRGLIHANKQVPGLVHRDLKPANILITDDRVAKITDWGLSRVFEQEPKIRITKDDTDKYEVIGTPLYMAPEVWLMEEQDARTDMYSVGCILYELLTGLPLIMANTIDACRHQHLEIEVDRLLKKKPIESSFIKLLTKSLAKDKKDRFISFEEMLNDLLDLYRKIFQESPRMPSAGDDLNYYDFRNNALTYQRLASFGRKQRYFFEKAIKELDNALALNPRDIELYIARSYLYSQLDRPTLATDDINKAIEIDPNSSLPYAALGAREENLGNHETAAMHFSTAIQLNPEDFESFLDRGRIYQLLGLYDKALEDFDRAIAMQPSLARAYQYRAIMEMVLKRFEAALQDLDKAIELYPYDYTAYRHKGRIFIEQNKLDEAVENFTHSLTLNPDETASYMVRGLLYKNLNRQDDALVDLNRSIEMQPNNAEYYFERAVLFMDLGNFKKAESDLTHALELDNASSDYWAYRGITYGQLGDLSHALSDLDEAIRIDSKNARALYNRGLIHNMMGNYGQSIQDYSNAIELNPKFLKEVYNNRGNSYSELGRFEEAIEDFNHALQLDPFFAGAYANRGYSLLLWKKGREALMDATRAILLDPNLYLSYFTIGLLFSEIGKIELGFPFLQEALNLGWSHSQAGEMIERIRKDWEELPSEKKQMGTKLLKDLQTTLIEEKKRFYDSLGSDLPLPQIISALNELNIVSYIQSDVTSKPLDLNDPEVIEFMKETREAIRLFMEAKSPEDMRKAVSRFPFMMDENDFIAMMEQDYASQVTPETKEKIKEHLTWIREIAQQNKIQESVTNEEVPTESPELEEADRLFTLARQIMSEGRPSKFEHALELADQAHLIYKRHHSPRSQESLSLVNSIFAIARKKRKP